MEESNPSETYVSFQERKFISFHLRKKCKIIPLGSVSRDHNKTLVVLNGKIIHNWEILCIIGKYGREQNLGRINCTSLFTLN